MRNNQISIQLAMRLMRFFNERPGSTKNKDRLFRRLWMMYPATTAAVFRTPYDFALTNTERSHREKPMYLMVNPLAA